MKKTSFCIVAFFVLCTLILPVVAVAEAPETANPLTEFANSVKDECLYLVGIAPTLLSGAVNTLLLFAISIVLSLPLGFLLCLAARSKLGFLRGITNVYIYVMRGTPLLLQLLAIYFGLPYLPVIGKYLTLERFTASCLAFVLNYAAYFAEIFRGGFLAVDNGQYEAAKVLGIGKFNTMVRIIIPQMIRVAIPSVANETITLVKDTALVYAIAVPEIIHAAKVAVNRDFTFTPFLLAALIYLLMTFVLTVFFKRIEKKIAFEKKQGR